MIPGRIRPPGGGFTPGIPTMSGASFQNVSQNPYCNVTWTAPAYTGKTSYYYEVDRDGSTYNAGTSTSLQQAVGGGSTYNYKVRIVSAAGINSEYSAVATCSTPGCCTPCDCCVFAGNPPANCPGGTLGPCAGANGCILSVGCNGGQCYGSYISGFCGCY